MYLDLDFGFPFIILENKVSYVSDFDVKQALPPDIVTANVWRS